MIELDVIKLNKMSYLGKKGILLIFRIESCFVLAKT